jgi:glycosyltransferase involved in cell wall biosynthesis
MSAQPVVTVLLPVYNADKYIGLAIESILAQTFADFELLIINDGSKDNTLKVIRSYKDPRIRVISRPNKGLMKT